MLTTSQKRFPLPHMWSSWETAIYWFLNSNCSWRFWNSEPGGPVLPKPCGCSVCHASRVVVGRAFQVCFPSSLSLLLSKRSRWNVNSFPCYLGWSSLFSNTDAVCWNGYLFFPSVFSLIHSVSQLLNLRKSHMNPRLVLPQFLPWL